MAQTDKKAEKETPVRVRAIELGIWNNARVKPGTEFTVPNAKAVGKWMERLDEPAKDPPADPPKVPPAAPPATP